MIGHNIIHTIQSFISMIPAVKLEGRVFFTHLTLTCVVQKTNNKGGLV